MTRGNYEDRHPTTTVAEDQLNEIRIMRAQNNDLWMKIVALALEHAPDKTKAVMREIEMRDRCITSIWGALAR